MEQSLYKFSLLLGDNSMILGQRLAELCGHGPSLETDIALTNISLDLFGQVRSYFQYAASLQGGEASEDTVAFLRYERQHYNVILVEQPNTDFAHVIARQFLFDAYHLPMLNQLRNSKDQTLAAIAEKSIKESKYHLRFSSEWVKRLGDGTEISHEKMQTALDTLYPFCHEFFQEAPVEKEMNDQGIGYDLGLIKEHYLKSLKETCEQAGLKIPESAARQTEGKYGKHSEHLGYILSDFQYMQRAYPNMEW